MVGQPSVGHPARGARGERRGPGPGGLRRPVALAALRPWPRGAVKPPAAAARDTVIGVGAGRGLELDITGFEVEKVELDVVGAGLQLRFYGRGGPSGFFGTVGAPYIHGSGTGIDAGGETRSYRLDGLETSLLGVGYEASLLRHLALSMGTRIRVNPVKDARCPQILSPTG